MRLMIGLKLFALLSSSLPASLLTLALLLCVCKFRLCWVVLQPSTCPKA